MNQKAVTFSWRLFDLFNRQDTFITIKRTPDYISVLIFKLKTDLAQKKLSTPYLKGFES